MLEERALTARYAELKSLIDSTPALETCDLADPNVLRWLGRAHTALEGIFNGFDEIQFQVASESLGSILRKDNAQIIRATLHRALARVEARLPASSGNAFIAPGNVWSAFVQISDVFAKAKSDVLVVDPYMDDSILRDYGGRLADGVTLRLLTTTKVRRFVDVLVPAAQKWNAAHPLRPASVRSANQPVHDRIIAIDQQSVWIVTQSLKDLGATAPATVTKFVDDLTPEKLSAYESIWATATAMV